MKEMSSVWRVLSQWLSLVTLFFVSELWLFYNPEQQIPPLALTSRIILLFMLVMCIVWFSVLTGWDQSAGDKAGKGSGKDDKDNDLSKSLLDDEDREEMDGDQNEISDIRSTITGATGDLNSKNRTI